MKFLLFISLIIFSSCNLNQKSCAKFEEEYNKLKEGLPTNENEIKDIENLLDTELKEIYSNIRQYSFCEMVHLNKIDEKYEKYYLTQLETTINILKAFYILNQID
jgi:predicted phage-related endonuclease